MRLVLCVVLIVLASCRGDFVDDLATPDHPVMSPSGQYRLVVFEDRTAWGLRVESASGEAVLEPPERFERRHRTYFLWDDTNRPWVYSGDIGVFYWERAGDAWTRRDWVLHGGVPAPPALVKRVPMLEKWK